MLAVFDRVLAENALDVPAGPIIGGRSHEQHSELGRGLGDHGAYLPYRDGYEHRDERLAILAAGARGKHLAILLRQWSSDVVLLSNGPHGLDADQLARVQALGIPIIETPVIAMK